MSLDRIPLYEGDILEANYMASSYHRFLMRVTRVSRRKGIRQRLGGQIEEQSYIIPADRLVACGVHEDCRVSIDLAVACATERVSHQVSTSQTAKGPQR